MHHLLFLDPEDNFIDTEKINQIICAEIPDKTSDPDLFEIVTSCVLYGPCGDLNPRNPFMIGDGRGGMICSKRFPKEFQDETFLSDGYPLYRRRRVPSGAQNNFFYSVRSSSRIDPDIIMENRWLAPYNP